MLDRDYFQREFPRKIRAFSDARESVPVRVVIATISGRHFDLQRMTSDDIGLTLFTREDTMIFVPYGAIEHIEVAAAEDRRVQGFEIRGDPDDGG